MTIDEVIKIYKNITSEGAPCPRHCMLPCDKCVQECKQVLEWLEELKAYKEKPEGWMWDEAEQKGYNKAIDDLREKLIQNGFIFTEHALVIFEAIAEQLKAGGTSGIDN